MDNNTILKIKDVTVVYKVQLQKNYIIPKFSELKALDSVSLDVKEGEVLGIVGESGCGKSTLAKAIVGLVPIKTGTIEYNKSLTTSIKTKSPGSSYSPATVQMIFQSPQGSLDPRMTVFDTVAEPLQIHHPKLKKAEVRSRVDQVLTEVGLSALFESAFPHELSGGQCQRVGIARALILEPKVLICDEPISSLDVSIQSQIINLLQELKEKKNLTILFIAHDISAVRHISDRILVMYLGKIMEVTTKAQLVDHPFHPYTRSLIDSVPVPEPGKKATAKLIEGEIPSPINPPSGCIFRTRCPLVIDDCSKIVPKLFQIEPGVKCACIVQERALMNADL